MTPQPGGNADAAAKTVTNENTTWTATSSEDVLLNKPAQKVEDAEGDPLESEYDKLSEHEALDEIDLASAALQSLHKTRQVCRKFFAMRSNSSRGASVRNALASSANTVEQAISESRISRRGAVQKPPQQWRKEQSRHNTRQLDEIDALLQRAAREVKQERNSIQHAKANAQQTGPMKSVPSRAILDSAVLGGSQDKPLGLPQPALNGQDVVSMPRPKLHVAEAVKPSRAAAIKRPFVGFGEGQAMYGEGTEEFRTVLLDKMCWTCLHDQRCDKRHGLRMLVHVRTTCFSIFKRRERPDALPCECRVGSERGHRPEELRLEIHTAWMANRGQRNQERLSLAMGGWTNS